MTGGLIWAYKARQSQWEQWSNFLEDLKEIKGIFINPAREPSFAPLKTFSTSVLAEAATRFQSESPASQGLHDSQKQLKMLTPNLVELRLAQHQGSFKTMVGQGQKESSKKAGPGLIQGYSVNQLPSNNPIEDDLSRHVVRNEDGGIERLFFGVFDGHSGWCCSQKVARELAPSVAKELNLVKNSNDTKAVIEAIERGFMKLDHRIVHDSVQRVLEHPSQPLACASLLPALSGSCALMAYVDTKANDLYIACTGDSRAVMGVLESTSEGGHVWRAMPLSMDQTGRNKREVKRLQTEHPGEENTVVMRGRVLGGLEPTRAFGDARYKWSKEIQDKVFALFPAYRKPPRNYKTPPYVTAKPVVRHHRIQPEDRFLVMATDGLWDKLTSDEVVQLVGNLLDGKIGQEEMILDREEIRRYRRKLAALEATKESIGTDQQQEEDIDEELTPPNLSPKGPANQVRKFTYKDHTNASTHLIRNALGGADDDEVAATLSIPSPISRAYRDDITVTVIFFGPQDTTLALLDAYESGGFVDI
ncbi:hypothetical protein BG011_006722 [Mortierella polycephala]|uniref:PPM-type phosphatase domain-containing protein n=1 Tax=Mortierella polycephala TaxID=41804 RepID=A0A9P6PVB9_9FUNG|nr:hypothetical protein BG011_006722 [Mortierella polycephala]